MQVVRAKVRGQAANLQDDDPLAADTLLDLVRQVRSGDPTNVEARAARTFWSRYVVEEGFRRDRGADGRNSLLNYGYTVLRSMTVRSICAAGLSPVLGIAHSNRSNAFALADDLMEPFRPAVDWIVRTLPADASPRHPAVKNKLVSVLRLPFGATGVLTSTALDELAHHFARYVEGDEQRLRVPAWSVPDG